MRILQTAYIVLCICSVIHDAKLSSDSEFIGAVCEHVFFTLENRTKIPTRQEALDVVMANMNVYEQQILEAKTQVRIKTGTIWIGGILHCVKLKCRTYSLRSKIVALG